MGDVALQPTVIQPGLAVIHANRMEHLREVLVSWLRQHPLAPLEDEVVLVQSSGMAQWLKLALAADDGLGICANLSTQLPASFLWRVYRQVVGELALPEASPFEREALTWRLFRLLPAWLDQPAFAALQRFLAADTEARKRYQLAACLADLLDQYQVYRADWLADWAAGRAQLCDAWGQPRPLPSAQAWQPLLWRALLADMPETARDSSRAQVHERCIALLEAAATLPPGLPRRVIVFGISALPQQMLQALFTLGRHSQILLCVHNPCRHYWADIIEHRELLRAAFRRQPQKVGMPVAPAEADLHLHAHPLLAAWGKQGRDYIRLLDQEDAPERYADWFQKIDLFTEIGTPAVPLLQQVQQAILDLEPLPASPAARPVITPDDSVVFHSAHSPQREVEILHDQLLARFAMARSAADPLRPRDVLVMVPDIDRYAPHIQAVFGQIAKTDGRYLPFSVADQRQRGHNPLLVALETLLNLPESRFAASDILDLLDVPAVRHRLGIPETALPTLHRWIEGAGIRWGLSAAQRHTLDLPSDLAQNTWAFGLQRMFLGYAVGAGEALQGIVPYDEIGGLDAQLVGPLNQLLQQLEQYWRRFQQAASADEWVRHFEKLLEDFFQPSTDQDRMTLERLSQSLEQWADHCRQAAVVEPLPLSVVREAWLAGFDEPNLTQRFLGGCINFCTLMPMRAIPFKVVCLLGMNEGDYPRRQPPPSFDLMRDKAHFRPGDRSRRDDDRYMFLEALLSAREQLYISWVGRSVQDDSRQPPSILVGQLRDYLANAWQVAAGPALVDRLTFEHPLQPFSPRYFPPPGTDAPDWFSFAHEWRAAHGWEHPAEPVATPLLAAPETTEPLTLETLAAFLRQPVQTFFNERLKVRFEDDDTVRDDLEPFTLDHLERYILGDELLQALLDSSADSAEATFAAIQQQQQRRGQLPLGGFAAPAQQALASLAWSAYQRLQPVLRHWPELEPEPQPIQYGHQPDAAPPQYVSDWLTGLRRQAAGPLAQIVVRPQALANKKNQVKWHNLTRAWVSHLAGNACGLSLTTLIGGPDTLWTLPVLPQADARQHLNTLLEAYQLGVRAPLPVACKTAFAWLGSTDPAKGLDKAQIAYDGDGWKCTGERGENAHLARAYPDFTSLTTQDRHGRFEDWAERLYGPLFRHAKVYVEASS